MTLGPLSPSLASAFAPKAMRIHPVGEKRVENPERRWWTPWRRRFAWVPHVFVGVPVRMTFRAGEGVLASESPVRIRFVVHGRVHLLRLFADAEPVAELLFDDPLPRAPGDELYLEQASFLL